MSLPPITTEEHNLNNSQTEHFHRSESSTFASGTRLMANEDDEPAAVTVAFAAKQEQQAVLGKRGKLWKQGRGCAFGRANWTERDFVLTASPKRLCYFEGGNVRGSLDFEGQESKVERLLGAKKTGTSGTTEWRFVATCGRRTLNMAAATKQEMHEWIDAISNVLGVYGGWAVDAFRLWLGKASEKVEDAVTGDTFATEDGTINVEIVNSSGKGAQMGLAIRSCGDIVQYMCGGGGRRLAIFAEAGAGKTWMMTQLKWQCSKVRTGAAAAWVPVFVTVQEIRKCSACAIRWASAS